MMKIAWMPAWDPKLATRVLLGSAALLLALTGAEACAQKSGAAVDAVSDRSASGLLRPPVLEDFLKLTELGAVRPSPDGALLAVEVSRPRNVEVQTLDAERQDIWLIDVATGRSTRLTDGSNDARAAWSPIWSPDSQSLAFLHGDGIDMVPVVWKRSTGNLAAVAPRNVDFQVNFGRSDSPVAREWAGWVDNHTLLMQLQVGGPSHSDRSYPAGRPDKIWNERWADLREGRASATVWDSRKPSVCGVEDVLVLVDIESGHITELLAGAVRAVSLSPDRGFAAAIVATAPKPPGTAGLQASVLEYNQTHMDAHVETELHMVDLAARKDLGAVPGVNGFNFVSPRRFPRWAINSRLVTVPVYLGPERNFVASITVPDMQVQRVEAESTLDAEVLAELLSLNSGQVQYLANRSPFAASDMISRRSGAWGFRVPGRVLRTPDNRVAVVVEQQLQVLDREGRIELSLPLQGEMALPKPGDPSSAGLAIARGGDYLHVDLRLPETRVTPIAKPSREAVLTAIVGDDRAYVFTEARNDGTYLWVGRDGSWKQLEWNKHLGAIRPARQRIFHYTLRSGQSVAGRLWLPDDHVEGRPSPAVVLGYPGTVVNGTRKSSLNNFHLYHQNLLAAAGYVVIEPTIPYGDQATDEPLQHFADTALSALDGAIRQGYADPQKVGFVGHSFGGYLGLALEVKTNRFRAIVVSAAFPDLIDLAQTPYPAEALSECAPSLMRLRGPLYLETEGMALDMKGPPHEKLDRYLRNSPYFQIKSARTPLLLTYGEFDTVPTSVRKLYVALDRQGVPVQLAQYWGEGHNLQAKANIRDSWQRSLEWLDYYVKAQPASKTAK